ncbi:MAG: hypothetical protein ACFB02_17615 [Mastigocoleus sp.]
MINHNTIWRGFGGRNRPPNRGFGGESPILNLFLLLDISEQN